MLSREHRLRRSSDIQRVYRRGRRWAHPLLVLHVLESAGGLRIAVVAGKKVGPAVVRNRARRRVREWVRVRLKDWRDGRDVVIGLRSGAGEADFAALAEALEQVTRRAGLTAPREQECETS